LPQTQPEPQSCGQLALLSAHSGWHCPLPHTQLVAQSVGQVCVVSPHWGWHWKFPQMHG
jgi:hypothetical protein